jgi:hypothetical protein
MAREMSFIALYDAVQKIPGKISTKWLRDRAIELSDFTPVREQWSGVIDPQYIQGFFIEGPLEPPIRLDEHEALITLARSVGIDKPRRRFVYTKELMHLFDTAEEKADTPEKFDAQAERFGDPSAPTSSQFKAELKAFWRAVAVLCQEERRLEYKAALDLGTTSLPVVATALQIPAVYARHLFREEYPAILAHIQ